MTRCEGIGCTQRGGGAVTRADRNEIISRIREAIFDEFDTQRQERGFYWGRISGVLDGCPQWDAVAEAVLLRAIENDDGTLRMYMGWEWGDE